MSLESDMVQATEEMLAGSKEQITFLAQITSDTPLEAKVDGSSIAIPCIRTDATEMAIGKQVVLLKVGPKFYVVGALGTYVAPEIPVIDADARASVLMTNTVVPATSLGVMAGLTIATLAPGTYSCDYALSWISSGAINVDVRLDFTGTITAVGQQFAMYLRPSTGGTIRKQSVPMLGTSLGAESPDDLTVTGHGGFTVSTAGDLTVSFSRASGTTTVQAGSNVRLVKV